MKHNEKLFSVTLFQDCFDYDWVEEKKIRPNKYGDGHCYNDAFNHYLRTEFKNLHNRLQYDSENGMFCVYCNDIKDAEETAYELSCLYKDEKKMLELIKFIKEKLGYVFDCDVKI